MSKTSTTTIAPGSAKKLQRTGSILLSPSKRRRISGEGWTKPAQEPSAKEIWEWTLTSSAVAKCYVRDAMALSPSTGGHDFSWLGSVPCRKIEICGVVVGIQEFEKKIVYTVDDGTSVIECVHTPRQFTRPVETSRYAKPLPPPPPPEPLTRIGGVVKVVGRVKPKFEYQVVLVDEISISTFGDQLNHWKRVRELHRTKYSHPGPFIIPVTSNNQETPRKSPVKIKDVRTPSRVSIAPRNAVHTPSTVFSSPTTIASSPINPVPDPQQSPPKLRHPSRLHSHNLTDTAFLLYVKHFIDNAPEDVIEADSDSEDDDDSDLYLPPRKYTSQILGTPTKFGRCDYSDRTPRVKHDATPRPLTLKPVTSTSDTCKGFTLSYLRRVPELSLMAKRVVKYRTREEDKKAARETAPQSSKQSSSSIKRTKLDKAGLAKRKKRLFQWAICELLREGSIVLWDGPKRPCPEENTYGNPNASKLWKYSSSSSTTYSDNTLFSNASNSNSALGVGDGDELELSDPEPDEEAYISTKPELLASCITNALKELASAPRRQIVVVKRHELIGGSTKEDILGYLRRDDRWAFIGEWNIAAALEYMEQESLAWRVGPERWLLTQ